MKSNVNKRFNYRQNKKRILDAYKKISGCIVCRRNSPPECLDFHHINQSKTKNLSILMNKASYEKMIDEIGKCVVLCSNCHRLVHQKAIKISKIRGRFNISPSFL